MHTTLTAEQKLELYYWMILTRTFDERMVALYRQGRGLGGVFSQRGHEAISVAVGYALEADDIVAPMHRDLGTYLLRGMAPRRVFSNMLGRATGITRGRDANLHGSGDMSLGLVGFISHLPLSLPVALGVAMSFRYRNEPRVALTFCGDGSASAGIFHETMNMAALYQAPYVLILENNQYAYSTPVAKQTRETDFSKRAIGYGIPGLRVDGNDVEVVYEAVKEAIERARAGGGPSIIETTTMRMLGHAIHDGAEYVPRELLAHWEAKDPVINFARKLVESGVTDRDELDEIGQRAAVEIEDAINFAESSPFPDPATVAEGVYAE